MDDGVRDAFCPILWRHNGGAIDQHGQPILGACGNCNGNREVRGEECQACNGTGHNVHTQVRGYCTRAYDCANCKDLQQELSYVPLDEQFWVCPDCLGLAYKEAKVGGFKLIVPGHYQETICQSPHCKRQESTRLGTPPGYSLFIQLVIGPLYR